MERFEELVDLKDSLLTTDEQKFLQDNITLGLTAEVDFDISEAKGIVANRIMDDLDINDIKSVELYNKAGTGAEKTEELIKVLEGSLERCAYEKSDKAGIDIINSTVDAINKASEYYNGIYVSFVPEDYDYLIKFDDDSYCRLGETGAYEELFTEMIEREQKKEIV